MNSQENYYSEETSEVLNRPPHALIRSGNALIFILVLLFAGLAVFVRYPDVLSARATVVGQKPPVPLRSRITGKISRLFVSEGESVTENKVLAVMENSADFESVIRLRSEINALEKTAEPANISVSTFDNLGELQNAYETLLKTLRDSRRFQESDYYGKQTAFLEEQIQHYNQLNTTALRQTDLNRSDAELSKRQYGTDSVLNQEKFLSRSDLDRSRSNFIQKEFAVLDGKAAVLSGEIKIRDLRQRILDLQIREREESDQFLKNISRARAELMAKLGDWELRYLIVAPTAGQVSFHKIRTENREVNEGDEILALIPESSELYCTALLPVAGAGKAAPGQKVFLQMSDFPHMEFGAVRAEIEQISPMPREGLYTVKLRLPEGLRTVYGYEIPERAVLDASAEIITGERSLAQRFFDRLRHSASKY